MVYEIYSQSFYDTNGDLKGIIQKPDYIQDMGFTAIWMNPINKSALRDAGYGVTDFYAVDPHYGTNEYYKKPYDEVLRFFIKCWGLVQKDVSATLNMTCTDKL